MMQAANRSEGDRSSVGMPDHIRRACRTAPAQVSGLDGSACSDNLLIGLRPGQMHYGPMIRLRLLAGFLGCLAILASGVPAVVLASAPMLNATPAQTTASEPCTHCPDCDDAPCQQAAAGCVLACVAAPLTIGVADFALPVIDTVSMIWPGRSAAISGQSPPPDPFPPRT